MYGVRRELTEDLADGALVFRPFSETVFLDDLRSARAVIAGGGFSLLSECVYLHKPVLSIPVEGQFEQVLNARYLEKLGYGEYARGADAAGDRRVPRAASETTSPLWPPTGSTATTRRWRRSASSSRWWRWSAPAPGAGAGR